MAYAAVTPHSLVGPWSGRLYAALKGLVVVSAFAGLGGLMWYSYAEGARHGGKRIVPLIRAAAGPVKTRPAEPGGIRVPDKDKRIYERIAPQRRRKLADNVERLIPRPAPVAIAPDDASKRAGKRASAAKSTAKPKPQAAARPVIRGGPAKVSISIDRKPRRTVATKSAAAKPADKSTRAASAAASNANAYRVQIAAYPSAQMAASRWERLVGKHKDLIGRLEWYVEKVERINGRGPFYRLQLGPLKNRKAAKELCAKLGKRKVSCLFVRG